MHLNQSSSSNNFSGNFDDNQLLFIIHHTIQYNTMQCNAIQYKYCAFGVWMY